MAMQITAYGNKLERTKLWALTLNVLRYALLVATGGNRNRMENAQG